MQYKEPNNVISFPDVSKFPPATDLAATWNPGILAFDVSTGNYYQNDGGSWKISPGFPFAERAQSLVGGHGGI